MNINISEYESATSLVNYTRDDCIIDYLELLKKNKYTIDCNSLKKRKLDDINEISNSNKKHKTSFDYIVEDGYIFENNIFNDIKKNMDINNELNKLYEFRKTNNISEQFKKTVTILISKKYDIILGSVLINKKNNTYGYPDIIVSGYWINKYIVDSVPEVESNRNKYYIIDVKSSTITLINSGEHVSSGLLYNGYKQQIYIYTNALNNIFKENNIDNEVNIGFILGKRYKYISNKNTIIINNPFERLGIINYDYEKMHDNDYNNIIENAIKWKKELKENWQDYTINPINKDELYPNMKNNYDKNYRKIKKMVAYENKEITLLWNIGIKNRKLAWKQKIKNYNNPDLTCNILGLKDKSKRSLILNKMIDMTRSDELVILDKESNYMNWCEKLEYEFFVDFETYNNELIYDESKYTKDEIIEFNDNQKIYMIGVCHEKDNEYIYKCFIINNVKYNNNIINRIIKKNKNNKCKNTSYIFCNNELDLMNKFVDYIVSFKPININIEKYYKMCRLIHWSYAEPMLFNKKININKLLDRKYILPWYDLLKVYKNEENPIIIKECFSFGLKEVVKKLNEYNMIDLSWPELDDGLLSSFIARDIYNNKLEIYDTNSKIINIVEYNYIDCIAIEKLLGWMRRYINL